MKAEDAANELAADFWKCFDPEVIAVYIPVFIREGDALDQRGSP